jgi:hypothetical protein
MTTSNPSGFAVIPAVFTPINAGGLPPKDYTFALRITDNAVGTGGGAGSVALMALATNQSIYTNDQSLFPRVSSRIASDPEQQIVTVMADVDGSIFETHLSAAASSLAITLSPMSYRM